MSYLAGKLMIMTTTTQTTDPRSLYAAATSWVLDLVRGTTEDQLDRPTPCDDFDVRSLIGHVMATVARAESVALRGDIGDVGTMMESHDAQTLGSWRDRALAAWSDDDLLDRPVTVPWGNVPGRGALFGYTNEALVHGWDLAVATGQSCEAPDQQIAETILPVMQQFLSADLRGGPVPFAPVVEPRTEAGATERLANWSGRISQGWVTD